MALKDNINARHAEYDSHVKRYKDLHKLYLSHSVDDKTPFIIQQPHENSKEYEARRKMLCSVSLAHKPILQILNLFSLNPPTRDYESIPLISSIITDATGYGVSMDTFIKQSLKNSLLWGSSLSYVDFTSDASNKRVYTKADMNERNFPFIVPAQPSRLVNWVKKPRVGYTECLFEEDVIDATLGMAVKQFVYIDSHVIEVLSAQGKSLSSCEHKLGYAPVFEMRCPFYSEFGLSLGEMLASAQQAQLNLSSHVAWLAGRQTLQQYTFPDDGSIEELAAKGSDKNRERDTDKDPYIEDGLDTILTKVSSSSAVTFPSNVGHPPMFITPPADRMLDIWQVHQELGNFAINATGLGDMAGNIDVGSCVFYVNAYRDLSARLEENLVNAIKKMANIKSEGTSVKYPLFAPPQ